MGPDFGGKLIRDVSLSNSFFLTKRDSGWNSGEDACVQ